MLPDDDNRPFCLEPEDYDPPVGMSRSTDKPVRIDPSPDVAAILDTIEENQRRIGKLELAMLIEKRLMDRLPKDLGRELALILAEGLKP